MNVLEHQARNEVEAAVWTPPPPFFSIQIFLGGNYPFTHICIIITMLFLKQSGPFT